MSKNYLFVAEADKIQDLLFRSSKLREVAGGSQMLKDFCKNKAPRLVEKFGGNILISSGGSFRILFDEKEKAEKFGDYLAELYRRKFDGTITIAKPVEVKSEKEAIKKAQVNLRKAKHSGKLPLSVEQMPYMATCASCGVGLAKYYKKRYQDERENYLCSVCEKKFKARDLLKKTFLSQFYSYVANGARKNYDFPKDADTLAELEARNYVAYVMADVNDMGIIFSSCDSFEKLRILSDALDKVMPQSLAVPTKIVVKAINDLWERSQKKGLDFIPVLPLIMAGDDLFTLIPAQWSLDFTLRFCEEFERRMKQSLKNEKIYSGFSPTISVSVIICKGNLSYSFVYSLGEEMLKAAKKIAKDKKASHISFRVVTGSETVKTPEGEQTFVAGYPAYSIKELKKLIAQRFNLKETVLPARRRAQLQSLFHKAEELQHLFGRTGFQRMEDEWLPEIEGLLRRLDETPREKVREALKELGDPNSDNYWQKIDGAYYHQFPDLLLAWDFAYDLTIEPREYEEAEE
jgi:CRISPR/Cas system-associated protein Cas10 (large subunit of type III CRISPR-Cas system)